MASVINTNSQDLYQYQERITHLKESFARQNTSGYQIEKIWNYVKLLWQRETGKQVCC